MSDTPAVIVDFDGVRELLPQAYPFVLIDRVVAFKKDMSITVIKNITGNEWFFPGHFPRRALFPGCLMVEVFAQAGILLTRLSGSDPGATFKLVGVQARFTAPVVPGDCLTVNLTVEKLVSWGGIVSGSATADCRAVASAQLTFSIEEA